LILFHEKLVETMAYEIRWIENGGCAGEKSAVKTNGCGVVSRDDIIIGRSVSVCAGRDMA